METWGWCESDCKDRRRPGPLATPTEGKEAPRATFILETPVLLNILAPTSPQINKLRDEYQWGTTPLNKGEAFSRGRCSEGEGVREAVRGGVRPALDDPRRKRLLSFVSVHGLRAGQVGRGTGRSHRLLLCQHKMRSRGYQELCSFGNHCGKCFSGGLGRVFSSSLPSRGEAVDALPGRSRHMGLPQFPSPSYSDFQTLTCAPQSPQAGALVRIQPTPRPLASWNINI